MSRSSDPLIKSYYNTGFRGNGKYIVESKAGQVWCSMLQRCYSKVYQLRQPTYKGCSVTLEWDNFQNFAEWFENNYIKGWQLDKDILFKGNKIYSPETCCFVPQIINVQFNGFQRNKKSLLKGVFKHGNKFKVEGTRDSKRVYLGLHDTLDVAENVYIDFKLLRIKEEAEKFKLELKPDIYEILINYKLYKHE